MKIDVIAYSSHNPHGEDYRVSRLRENFTSGSEGEGLETGFMYRASSLPAKFFFKMAKQHLKLTKEIQCRDFDAMIAHTSIVFMRYMFLAYQYRMQTDHHTFGDLFYACCGEVADISFMQAIYRILILATDRLEKLDALCEKTTTAFSEAVMNTALQCVGLSKNNLPVD